MRRLPLFVTFLIVLLVTTGCESIVFTTPGYPYPEPSMDDERQIIDMTGHAAVVPLYRSNNGVAGINLTQGGIDRDQDGRLDDAEAFKRMIRRRVPAGFTGYVALDWEEPIFSALKKPASSREFKDAVTQLTQAIAIARSERPTARWGFYGLPLREYWKRDDTWRTRSRALVDVVKACDWLGPSVYNVYKAPDDRPAAEIRKYAREHAEMALELGRLAGGKPVFPWVTHRYHPSNKNWADHVVPESEFRNILAGVRDARYNGERVAGVIWWGADEWYDGRGRIPDTITGDRGAYFRELHIRYMKILGAWATE